jgi:tRNA(fMet)-specific endonuclease VapC
LTYLLDTNVVIALVNDRPLTVRERLRRIPPGAFPISVPTVVLFELWYGVARSQRRPQNGERLRGFLSGNVRIIPFEEEDALIAGELRAELAAAGSPIGPYDLLVAAQALRLKATLVTANIREFRRVPGLVWEDWTEVV